MGCAVGTLLVATTPLFSYVFSVLLLQKMTRIGRSPFPIISRLPVPHLAKASPLSPYSADKRNDGSFKRWCLGIGGCSLAGARMVEREAELSISVQYG